MTRTPAAQVRLLDELSANATAATMVHLVDGWLLRAAPEYPVPGCNSALPYAGDRNGLEARITLAEAFYQDRGLPVRFQISPAALPVDLDGVLETRGYAIEEPTLVLLAEIDRVVNGTAPVYGGHVLLSEGIDMRHVSEYASGIAGNVASRNRLAGIARILQHLGREVATAVLVDQKAAAVGHCVLERGWAGVYAMSTRSDARRQGAATTILHRLAHWAQSRGASRMYLQVEATNDGARQLYTRAGFQTVYRFHYRAAA